MNNIFVKDNANRIRTLQGARFLFVVLIYMSHCVTENIVEPFDFGGEIGVSFFFVLSGFVLSWAMVRESVGEIFPQKSSFGGIFGNYIRCMFCCML